MQRLPPFYSVQGSQAIIGLLASTIMKPTDMSRQHVHNLTMKGIVMPVRERTGQNVSHIEDEYL